MRTPGLFRPYRVRNVFSIYDATNLLPRWVGIILPFYLSIDYWQLVLSGAEVLVIDLKNNLSPDRPHALCPMLSAHCSLLLAPCPKPKVVYL